MGFWSFKKDPKKEREKQAFKRMSKEMLPRFVEVNREFRKLSRKERKQYKEISENISNYVSLGVPSHYDFVDLTTISKDDPEYRTLRGMAEREIELVREYLSKHPEIPENLRSLILRYHITILGLFDFVPE